MATKLEEISSELHKIAVRARAAGGSKTLVNEISEASTRALNESAGVKGAAGKGKAKR